MKSPFPITGAVLLAGLCASLASVSLANSSWAQQGAAPSASGASSTQGEEYKISAEDIARKNPVKSSPEGLAEARKAYRYDCAMCHGEHGDGKGELVESMNLTMVDWRDPAALAAKSDGELFYIITKGKGKMTGEGDRQSEKLRWNLVNLVRSLAAKSGAQKSPAAVTQ
jgi:mono/diheme cytochrome c family protein